MESGASSESTPQRIPAHVKAKLNAQSRRGTPSATPDSALRSTNTSVLNSPFTPSSFASTNGTHESNGIRESLLDFQRNFVVNDHDENELLQKDINLHQMKKEYESKILLLEAENKKLKSYQFSRESKKEATSYDSSIVEVLQKTVEKLKQSEKEALLKNKSLQEQIERLKSEVEGRKQEVERSEKIIQNLRTSSCSEKEVIKSLTEQNSILAAKLKKAENQLKSGIDLEVLKTEEWSKEIVDINKKVDILLDNYHRNLLHEKSNEFELRNKQLEKQIEDLIQDNHRLKKHSLEIEKEKISFEKRSNEIHDIKEYSINHFQYQTFERTNQSLASKYEMQSTMNLRYVQKIKNQSETIQKLEEELTRLRTFNGNTVIQDTSMFRVSRSENSHFIHPTDQSVDLLPYTEADSTFIGEGNEMKKYVDDLMSENFKLKVQLQEKHTLLEKPIRSTLNKAIEESAEHIQITTKDLENIIDARQKQEEELLKQYEKVKELETKLQEKEMSLEFLSGLNKDGQRKIVIQETEISNLKKALDENQRIKEVNDLGHKQLETEYGIIKLKLESLEKEKKELEDRFDTFQKNQTKSNEISSEYHSVLEELNSCRDKIQELMEANQTLQTEKFDMLKEMQQYTNKEIDQQEMNSKMRQAISESPSSLISPDEKQKYIHKIRSLEEDNRKLKAVSFKMRDSLNKMKELVDYFRSSLENSIESPTKNTNTMSYFDNKKLQKEIETLKSEAKLLRIQKESLEKELQELRNSKIGEAEYLELQKENEQLKKQLQNVFKVPESYQDFKEEAQDSLSQIDIPTSTPAHAKTPGNRFDHDEFYTPFTSNKNGKRGNGFAPSVSFSFNPTQSFNGRNGPKSHEPDLSMLTSNNPDDYEPHADRINLFGTNFGSQMDPYTESQIENEKPFTDFSPDKKMNQSPLYLNELEHGDRPSSPDTERLMNVEGQNVRSLAKSQSHSESLFDFGNVTQPGIADQGPPFSSVFESY